MKPYMPRLRRGVRLELEAFEELGRMLRGEGEEEPRPKRARRRAAGPARAKAEASPYAQGLGVPLLYRGRLYVPWPTFGAQAKREGCAKRKGAVRPTKPKPEPEPVAGQIGKKLPKLERKYAWQSDE